MNLVDAVLCNAERRPDWPALEKGGAVLTYAGLRDAVDDRARRLLAAGIAPGALVGLAMRDTIGYVVAMLALFRVGAVLLPVDVRWTVAEKRQILAFFGSAALLVDDPVAGLEGVRQVAMGALPDPVAGPVAWPHDPEAPLLLSLSSGTTGIPKGPRLTSRQFQARLMAEWIGLGFLSSDRFLCATPLYFGGGRGFTLSHLVGGATTVLHPPPYDAASLPQVIEQERITSLFLVPTILRRLASEPIQAGLGRLRLLVSSGSALHPEERARIMATLTPGFYNLYASTEGGSVSVLTPDAPDSAAGSVGRSAVMSRFEIADDAGALLPPGAIGHIRQRAPWLPDGFWNNPEESAKHFRDGAYYPGDMGYADPSGYLHITGRSKDMIIRGGVNIYPDEIERVLLTHPAISEAAIVAWPSAEFGEEVAAFVTLRTAAEPEALREHCRASLASYKLPRAVFVLNSIPKTSAGKVQKAALAQRLPKL